MGIGHKFFQLMKSSPDCSLLLSLYMKCWYYMNLKQHISTFSLHEVLLLYESQTTDFYFHFQWSVVIEWNNIFLLSLYRKYSKNLTIYKHYKITSYLFWQLEKRNQEEKMKRDRLNDQHLDLMEKQRLYFKTVKDFTEVCLKGVMVFNATFNNISVISFVYITWWFQIDFYYNKNQAVLVTIWLINY